MNTEQFIKKSKNKFGDRFTYNNTIYVSCRETVEITCKYHGGFNVKAYSHIHLFNGGCNKCTWVKNFDFYENHIKDLGFELINVISSSNMIVKDTDGLLYNTSCKQIRKHGFSPSIMSAIDKTSYFIKISKSTHVNKIFDYSESVYVDSKTPIKIICQEHGMFEQITWSHMDGRNGCNECISLIKSIKCRDINIINNTIKNNKVRETILERFKDVHGDRYNYEKTVYTKSNEKLIITCKTHGDFKITSSAHLQGSGCTKCAFKNNPRLDAEKIRLYIIRCYNDSEEFFKIGITYKTIENRFSNKNFMPYSYEIKQDILGDITTIKILEKTLHKLYKKHSYTPLNKFSGWTECFKMGGDMTEYGLITVLVNDETIKKEISDLIEKALEEYKKNTEIEWVIQ